MGWYPWVGPFGPSRRQRVTYDVQDHLPLDCRINIYNTCLTCGSHTLNRIDSLFNIFITVNFAILIS